MLYVHIVTDVQMLLHSVLILSVILHDCRDCLFVDHEPHGLSAVCNQKLPDYVADGNLLS